MRDLLGRLLVTLGFASVRTCDSGWRALELLDEPQCDVDLILLDLIMPGMDGVQLVRELGERRFAGSVILLSGEDESTLRSVEALLRARHVDVIGHLRKPLTRARLEEVLARRPERGARNAAASVRTYDADELRRGIANREIINHYQPNVSLATGTVMGVECLARWRHPTDGLVYPDRFIGVAEAHGLIDGLTSAVFEAAIAQACTWRSGGLLLRIAVNLSVESLAALDFPDRLERDVLAAGIPPRDVILEITESRFIGNPAAVLDVLTRLRMKRFRLSIDDFGTGHSSLEQLRIAPFDELKIDRGFVHGAARDPRLRAIYDASLELARRLGLATVGEGVADEDDWRLLRDTGCDLAQGYFIAKPMPADEVAGWIEGWRERVRSGILRDDASATPASKCPDVPSHHL